MKENALPFLLAMITRTTFDEESDITDMASIINAMRATAVYSIVMLNETGHARGTRGLNINDPDERAAMKNTILGNFKRAVEEAFDTEWFHDVLAIAESWSEEEIENYFYGPGCD